MENERLTKNRILYLLEAFLIDNGYKESADTLRLEANLSDEYTICDNIRLEMIILEYEIYYYQRFKTYPKICKKVNYTTDGIMFQKRKSLHKFKQRNSSNSFKTECIKLNNSNQPAIAEPMISNNDDMNKSINNGDWNEYKNLILQTIINPRNVNVRWEDVKGLEDIKEILKEAIIYPIKYPTLFNSAVEPWKSILMYGPPGTGKTLLAKAITTESTATVFNISCSFLINKWRGETEKLIKVLFGLAQTNAPSIIFIDEVDAFALRRCYQEHEASRRMKSELFTQVDGLVNSANKNVFLLATTNTPWDLDIAMLRRFEKHIYVPNPSYQTRILLLEHFLPEKICDDPVVEIDVDYSLFAEHCDQYSGSDISNICKEIKLNIMRQYFFKLESNNITQLDTKVKKKIMLQDFENTLEKFKPVSSFQLETKYSKWTSSMHYL